MCCGGRLRDDYKVELSGKTVERTYLTVLSTGDRVNVERPIQVEGRLDGHVVKGTVDATTRITRIERRADDWLFTFAVPDEMERYVVEKGAVALDGASLTVADVDHVEGTFTVAVVPATYTRTVISEKAVGGPVHFEADALAKYVQQGQEVADVGAVVSVSMREKLSTRSLT